MTYSPPVGFVSKVLGPSALSALCSMLTPQTSLPRFVPGTDLSGLSDEQVEVLAFVLRELQVAEARRNAAAFVEYAIANERTGEPLSNAAHHNEWHEFLDRHPRAVLFAPVEHAKTTHVAVGRVLWALGNNPNLRLALISNTSRQAEKILSSIKLNIEANPRVREVFPDLVPSDRAADPWHGSAITVARSTIAKDPSIQALGVGGPLVGSRLDGAVLDDVLDFENTRTIEQMQKLTEWCETTLLTRLTEGAFLHVIGTPWSNLDLLHELEKRPGFACRRYSAVYNPHDPSDLWRPIWPEQFSRERLKSIHDDMTPSNFVRKYFCLVTTNDLARFRLEWLDLAATLGRVYVSWPLAPLRTGAGRRLPTFTGVDLAVGRNAKSDLTVILTIAVDDSGRKIVCDLQAGRWQAPDILAKIKAAHDRYDSTVVVEDNGAQSFLLQWALDMNLPVTPFTTGRNKHDERFGVESIAIEMRAGEWVFPSGGGLDPEIQALRNECLTYDPNGHTGDRLMALWFAREAARTRGMGVLRDMPTLTR